MFERRFDIMAVILLGFFLCVLINGCNGAEVDEKGLCYSNFLNLFNVVTDERKDRLLNEADVKQDIKKLEEQNRRLEEKLDKITTKLPKSDINRQIAFSGKLSRKIPSSEFKQIVKFDDVVTNIGNAYDTATGIFRCPVSGLYLVSINVLGDTRSNVIMETRQGEKLIARAHSGLGSIGHKSGSDTSVIHVNEGDEISSKVTGGGSSYLDHMSRFTVVLLKTD